MTRIVWLVTAALTQVLAGATPALGATASSLTFTVDAPNRVVQGVTTAIVLHLPSKVRAAEGRLLFDPDALDFVGAAPRGAGSSLRPEQAADGYTFGAYGLEPRKGQTLLDLVVYPKVSGKLQVRVVITAAADKQGNRLVLGKVDQLATVGVGSANNVFRVPSGPVDISSPRHAAQPAREFVANGRIDNQDLDTVRGDWYASRSRGRSCGAGIGSDANSDGCLDIVDLQAELAAQNTRTGSVSIQPLVRAAPQAIGDPISHTFVVNSVADTADAAPGNGVCADSLSRCTLRAAMNEADWLAGNDRIEFALPGTAPVTIQLSSRLPSITSRNGTVEIDGYSQPGSAVNTASAGSNAILGVEIRGNGQTAREMAFYITSAGNTIRGLLIGNVYRGVFLDGANAYQNRVVGNWIGFQKSGTSPGNGNIGVVFDNGANHNQIGTSAPADRNVIGNFTVAMDLYGAGTDYNVIQNNALCMRPNGINTATCSMGIDHNFGPKHQLIGGSDPSQRNVIGPTYLQGIELSHGWDRSSGEATPTYQINENHVIGNWVGFRGDGSYDPAFRSGLNFSSADNGQGINVYDGTYDNLIEGNYIASVYDGIQFASPRAMGNVARNNIIGVSPLGQPAPMAGWGFKIRWATAHSTIEGNTIRNAAAGGIGLVNVNNTGGAQAPAYNIRISQNIVSDTNGPGIDLFGPAGGGGAGPDPNDPGDVDSGANTQLNTPVLAAVTTAAVSGTAYAGATVELYRASLPAGQFGLPIAYLGSATVAGNGTWTILVALSAGDIVTALQVASDNNTSELAANVAVAANQAPVFSTDFTDRTDVEGAAISFDADATDPDGNALTYSATGLPAGISINTSTGVVSGTLSYASAGVHNVSLTVSDGTLTATDTFTWTVTNANRAPVFSTEFGDRSDAEGSVINLDANATDPDGDSLTYSATGLPGGLAINASTGVISGTLSSTTSGTYSTVITVSDGTLVDTDSFTWTVTEPSALTVYVDDTFSRSVVNSWGSAPTGGAYTLQGNVANYDVNGSVGTIISPSAGVLRSALLNTPSVADVELSFSVAADKTAAGTHQFVYAVVRRNGTNEYRVKMRLDTNGNVYVGASTVVNNTENNIGNMVVVPGLSHPANAIIRFRAQVSGASPTTIRVRAWADGSAEPATWNYTGTNSNSNLQAAGRLGLRTYVGSATSNAPVTFSFDDYRVTSMAP